MPTRPVDPYPVPPRFRDLTTESAFRPAHRNPPDPVRPASRYPQPRASHPLPRRQDDETRHERHCHREDGLNNKPRSSADVLRRAGDRRWPAPDHAPADDLARLLALGPDDLRRPDDAEQLIRGHAPDERFAVLRTALASDALLASRFTASLLAPLAGRPCPRQPSLRRELTAARPTRPDADDVGAPAAQQVRSRHRDGHDVSAAPVVTHQVHRRVRWPPVRRSTSPGSPRPWHPTRRAPGHRNRAATGRSTSSRSRAVRSGSQTALVSGFPCTKTTPMAPLRWVRRSRTVPRALPGHELAAGRPTVSPSVVARSTTGHPQLPAPWRCRRVTGRGAL